MCKEIPILVAMVFSLTLSGEAIAQSRNGSLIKNGSPILAPVEKRALKFEDIVTLGSARYGLPQSISVVPSALKGKPGLITTLPSRNTEFDEGRVMFTVSGRPTFVLQGEIPTYRDLTPGTSGDDVRQLEEALGRLGFDPGSIDGTYDEQTSAAVANMYQSSGWEPFGPTVTQLMDIRTLEQNVGNAEKTKLAATGAAAAAAQAVESARATAEHANRAAAAGVAARMADRALVMMDPRSTRAARVAADTQLQLARAAAKVKQLNGESAVQAAINALKVADLDIRLSEEHASRLAADLEMTKRKMGVQVPADEIVFIPSLPIRIEQATVLVGDAASGPVIAVTDTELAIDSSLPLDTAPMVKPGMKVGIEHLALGISAKGVVEGVADTPGTQGVDTQHIYIKVRVNESPIPLEGLSLRLTIPFDSTKGGVTAVPLSAVSRAADGISRLQVQQDNVLKYMVVEPGLSADGFVEITPVDGTLEEGQLVVVGYENPGNTPAKTMDLDPK